MIVSDEVCLGVAWTLGLLFFPLGDESPGEGIYDNLIPLGGYVFRQKWGVQRKPIATFAVFQVPTAQNNCYTKVARFGAACPELLQLYFVVAYPATIQYRER